MADDLFERFGDIIHEVPEIEEPLRAWRERGRQMQRPLSSKGQRLAPASGDPLKDSLNGLDAGPRNPSDEAEMEF